MINHTFHQQTEMLDCFRHAIINSCVVGVIDRGGSGFKHTLSLFSQRVPKTRISYMKFKYGRYLNSDLAVDMFKGFMNISFSNLKYKEVSATLVIKTVGSRIKTDLKGHDILIVFDHVDVLKTKFQLARFMRIVESINFKCGVVVRTTPDHLEKLAALDGRFCEDFFLFMKARKVIKPYDPEDIRNFCLMHGVTDDNNLEQISVQCKTLKQAMSPISKSIKFTTIRQLKLDFDFKEKIRVKLS